MRTVLAIAIVLLLTGCAGGRREAPLFQLSIVSEEIAERAVEPVVPAPQTARVSPRQQTCRCR